MYSPHAFSMNLTKRDLAEPLDGGIPAMQAQLRRFYVKYPEIKYMSVMGPVTQNRQGHMSFSHPATYLMKKTQKLIKDGYTEYKAFEIVGKELSEIIDKQREQQRLLRGVALDTNAFSYVERFQALAEAESALKVSKLERDMPKFIRAQKNYAKKFDKEINNINAEASALGMDTSSFLDN